MNTLTVEELAKEIYRIKGGAEPDAVGFATALLPFIQSRAAGVQGAAYDRELIATMLHKGASVQKFTADAIREQIRLLRAADNADAARVRTVSQPPKDANGDIVRNAIAILRGMPTDRIEYNEELSSLIRKLKPASPKEAAQVVATTQPPDPHDDSGGNGPCFSLVDWERLRKLPANTKLYTHPSPAHAGAGAEGLSDQDCVAIANAAQAETGRSIYPSTARAVIEAARRLAGGKV